MSHSHRARSCLVAGFGALLSVGLAACSPETSLSPGSTSPPTTPTAVTTSAQASEAFAAALAKVLRAPDARAELHRVLRASPYTRHKVHLQAWLHDQRASRVVSELAAALDRTPEALLAHVDALPPLEMAFPRRTHRLGWRVSDGVTVVAKFDASIRFVVGRTSMGAALTYPSAGALAEATLVIRPMSALIMRFQPQPDRPSAVIQDPDDGEIGVRSVNHHENGDSTVLQHAQFARMSRGPDGAISFAYPPPPDDGGGGGGGGGTYYGPPMRLGLLVTIGMADNLANSETNELRFEATHFQHSGAVIEQRTTHIDGVPRDYTAFMSLPLLAGSPSKPFVWNGTHVNMVVYEEDGWWGRDNYFDGQIFSNFNAAAQGLQGYPRQQGGQARCTYDQQHYCPFVEPDGVPYYWTELNFNLVW